MIAASNIVKKLQSGQSMRDLMSKMNLVMMAEPETYVETEKGKHPVQFELMKNATINPSYDAPQTEIYLCKFHRQHKGDKHFPITAGYVLFSYPF
jgi:hypothetical protein